MNKPTELFSHPRQEKPLSQNMSSRGLVLLLGGVVVGMVLSADAFALEVQKEGKKKDSPAHYVSSEKAKKSWDTRSDLEKEKDFLGMLMGPIRAGFAYLKEHERAKVLEILREADKKTQERGYMWLSKEEEKAKLVQEAEDQKAFAKALSPYLTEEEKTKAWEALKEERKGSFKKTMWEEMVAFANLEKEKGPIHVEEKVKETPLSQKEEKELWEFMEGFFNVSYPYLSAQERGKVWAAVRAATLEGMDRQGRSIAEEGSD